MTMAAFFRTTGVGHILRLAGNTTFGPNEHDDRKLLDYYLNTSNSSTPSPKGESGEEMVGGESIHLIDWMPSEPEVREN